MSGTDDGEGESCYGMTRAGGGGVVLGGCSGVGSWDGEVDAELTGRILRRAVGIYPELCSGAGRGGGINGEGKAIEGIDIVRVGVGLRPARVGGVRVEREVIDGVPVVHNYGHAGAGYQSSVGCAEEAVGLVERCFEGL